MTTVTRALTSASNMDRRARCPGSAHAEKGITEEDSPQSQEGTLLHELDANPSLSRAGLKAEQRDVLDRSAFLSSMVFEETHKLFGIPEDAPHNDTREREFWLHRGMKSLFPGHTDESRWYPQARVLNIIDKKFGYKVVTPAASNLQLRSYACMGAEEYPAEEIVVAITQPRLPYEQRLTMAAYSRKDIKDAREELFSIWDATLPEDAPRKAGPEQCRYCKAKLECPTYQAEYVELDKIANEAIIERCDDATLDRILVAIEFAKGIEDKAKEEARRRIEAGGLVNWDPGKPGSMRKLEDPVRAKSLLVGFAVLTDEEFTECAKPALGKLEERIRDKTKCTAKEAKEKLNSILGGLIESVPKQGSLTRLGPPQPTIDV